MKTKELAPELATFAFHGVDIENATKTTTGQIAVKVCPLCGDERSLFFISTKKDNIGQWDCKKCGKSGNRYTFLQLFYELCLSETIDKHYKQLGELRKTKFWQAFRNDGWAYDQSLDRWLIPIQSAEGSIVNLKVYLGPNAKVKWQNTAGCAQHFYGLESLIPEGPIFVCEGEADKSMLQFHFPDMDDRPHTIISAPGKDTFPNCLKRIKKGLFANRDFILLFDADELAKKKQQEFASLLSREHHARGILCLNWPESTPEKEDISDLFNSKGRDDAWNKIQSWLHPYSSRPVSIAAKRVSTLGGVFKEFRDTKVHLNRGMEEAITVVLAATTSVHFGGIPLWLYLVDPPGYGKSLILESVIKSPICHYQTDLKYTTLVSGFKTDPDPSLLAQLNNRVLVIKDYTTILDKNEVAQKELLGLLRDAYDGEVVREFGNGVVRRYPDPASGYDRCYFGMVCGVTPRIHVYNKAALGERFVKFSIGKPPVSSTDITRRAIEGANDPASEVINANRRQEVTSDLLEHLQNTVGNKPPSVSKYIDRLIALAEFAAVSRTRPERDRQTGDLLYEADPESSSRLGKQFTKALQGIAVVRGLGSIDEDCMSLTRKMAWITSYGWHRNIYKLLWDNRTAFPATGELAKKANLSVSGTQRVLADLRDLGIAVKAGKRSTSSKKGGRPSDEWKLSEHGYGLITRSRIFAK